MKIAKLVYYVAFWTISSACIMGMFAAPISAIKNPKILQNGVFWYLLCINVGVLGVLLWSMRRRNNVQIITVAAILSIAITERTLELTGLKSYFAGEFSGALAVSGVALTIALYQLIKTWFFRAIRRDADLT